MEHSSEGKARVTFEAPPDPPAGRRRPFSLVILASALFLLQHTAFAHDALSVQIAEVTAQIARDPSNAALRVRRAELYGAARQSTPALADLDRATALDPALATVDLVRSHVLLNAGRLTEAVAAASRFLTRQPGDTGALIVRARARVRLGRVPDAALDFTRALDARPTPDLYIERARVVLSLTGPEGALRGLDEGISRLGPVVTLELEAIDLELRLARYDAARARLDRLSAQAARKESWLARRGAILESAGRIDEARATYRAALTAVMRLPEWSRGTGASSALITRLRADLARLEPGRDVPAPNHRKGSK